MLVEITEIFYNNMKNLAAKKTLYEKDDADLAGACGGNYDDAYSLGFDDGEVCIARTLMNSFKTIS